MRCLAWLVCVLLLGAIGCAEAANVQVFPCTEEGIRDAIAEGGGPHRFACDGPTTVETKAVILVYKDVVIDGEANLTVSGGFDHRVFIVDEAVVFDARNFAITGGVHIANSEGPREQGGGGVLNKGTLIGLDITVSGNSAEEACFPDPEDGRTVCSGASGAAIFNEGTLHLEGAEVTGNEGREAIYNRFGGATIVRSTISRNTGAGIRSNRSNPSLEIIDSVISANGGNGISASFGTVGVFDSTVSKNQAGGISVNLVALRVSNTTISDNTAHWGALGGGLRGSGNVSERAIVTNSTVSGNFAGHGGGVALSNLTIVNSTVSGNIAAYRGSAFFFHDMPEIINTVVDGDCAGNDAWGFGHDVRRNIESPGDTCGFAHATNQVNIGADELKLGPLRDNGGPTQTHTLGEGSVAIDVIPEEDCLDANGDPLATDQRGESRGSGTMCDVGAFEVLP